MNILHINQSDVAGGAAVAGYRLHQGLLAQGIDSRLLVGSAKTNSDRIASVPRNYRIERLLGKVNESFGLNYLNHISSFNISQHPFFQEADILNFHNLHSEYFNYLAIPSLTKYKPAVFTLHDMWSFTGHCSYSYECDRWKTGCGKCPYLATYPEIKKDNTQIEWRLKNWTYQHSNLTIVSPSIWLTEQVKQSMFHSYAIHYIPHGIDTEAYQPLEIEKCRSVLNIPNNKKVLMFGAANLKESRKGGDLLVQALQQLPQSLKSQALLITLGEGGEGISETVGIQTLNLGYVGSDRLKAIAYSAADLFVFPSRSDIFGLVLQESMACGTPMVSFKVGGVTDLVRHGVTGYLAAPEDANDFCNGIVELLEDERLGDRMSQNCRAIALQEYPLDLQAKRYIELYRKIINN
ncbi:glycosyltransferase family 4 protein [Calothrix sp. NIES-2098]|uniref:glycosyltransferase family 4 protein n=1 Tax=Calothrix sp. NIES-2098 TaxID=1954171 RepID=UPI000B5EF68D|nr:group 1 glycosyl transferase [Calothrix sp. NIES-2098]